MKTICKFLCSEVTDHGAGNKSVKLSAVCDDGTDENKSFHSATPTGTIEFQWMNQNVFFEPQKEYFVEIYPKEET